MRIREEAKRQGEILSYHRIQETVLVAPGIKAGDPNTIVLLTEYKNLAAFSGREKLFASIREHLPSGTPGVLRQQREDLYETVGTRMSWKFRTTGERASNFSPSSRAFFLGQVAALTLSNAEWWAADCKTLRGCIRQK